MIRNSLIELYAQVLRVLATARSLYSKNTARRTIHALFNPEEATELLRTLNTLEENYPLISTHVSRMAGTSASRRG